MQSKSQKFMESPKPKAKVYIDGANVFYLSKKLIDLGKEVVVFSSRKMISWELKLNANKYVFLEDLKSIIVRK